MYVCIGSTCMHGCMDIWHMCVHTCACARMRKCTFDSTPPPPPQVLKLAALGLAPPILKSFLHL